MCICYSDIENNLSSDSNLLNTTNHTSLVKNLFLNGFKIRYLFFLTMTCLTNVITKGLLCSEKADSFYS